jgi:hypothetical protein
MFEYKAGEPIEHDIFDGTNPGFAVSDSFRTTVPGKNIADERVKILTRRTRRDGTTYVHYGEESTRDVFPRLNTAIPGVDVDAATGEKLGLAHMVAQFRIDQRAFRAEQSAQRLARTTTVALAGDPGNTPIDGLADLPI